MYRAIVAERIGTREAADDAGVADDPTAGTPEMKLIARRLHHEARRPRRSEIERHLMRRAGHGAGDRMRTDARLDRAMEMAAQHALDLRMARQDSGELGGAGQPHAIHVG